MLSSFEGFFCLQKQKKTYYSTPLIMEVSALGRMTFYENLLIGQETSVRCPY